MGRDPDEKPGTGATFPNTLRAAEVKTRVFVIDDMPASALLVAARIEGIEGVEATVFENPLEALDACRAQCPDLAIVDYIMPEMDGIEFVKAFRNITTAEFVPVIVLTAETDRRILYAALDAGATDFLRKPFDEVELIARCRTMIQLRRYYRMLSAANADLERLATTDSLTGALNRRAFLSALAEESQRIRRYGGASCVMMLDLDYFKQINDTFGHAGGDEALRLFVAGLRTHCRSTDRIGRLGGEEFAILLPETDRIHALTLAERIRAGPWVVSWPASEGGVFSFAVSIGVAEIKEGSGDGNTALQQADLALYHAKSSGRNAVACFADGISAICSK